jgi:hypothetical protein
VDHDASDADRIGGMHDAPCGVSNHRASEALALISEIDSEPREHNNRDWVGHTAPEPGAGATFTAPEAKLRLCGVAGELDCEFDLYPIAFSGAHLRFVRDGLSLLRPAWKLRQFLGP